MKRPHLLYVIFLGLLGCIESDRGVKVVYWGKEFPVDSAILFSPNYVSFQESREGNGIFSADGSRFYFTRTDFFNNVSIQEMVLEGNTWSSPLKAPFSDTGDNWEAAPSPDNEYVVFLSNRSNDGKRMGKPWLARMDSSRLWQTPEQILLPVPKAEGIGHPSIAADHTMYYSAYLPTGMGNIDIYFTDLNADSFEVVNLGAPVNSVVDELQPSMAADKSFLLFTSNRPGGYGNYDIYVSYADDTGWSEPKNLGPRVNTVYDEFSASLTPDGKFILFDRVIGREQDIYWISADAIDDLTVD